MLPFLLLACAAKEQGGATTDGADDTTPADDTADDIDTDVTCDAPRASSCGDEASVVRGVIWAGADGPTTGELMVILTHVSLGQTRQGGYYHQGEDLGAVDLAQGPVVFQIDMCDGGAMWEADYGDYNLLAILDEDGSNALNGFDTDRTPDEGEPSARVSPVALAPGGESQCFDDIHLDCVDGKSCTSY
jgi:hypothetical protein